MFGAALHCLLLEWGKVYELGVIGCMLLVVVRALLFRMISDLFRKYHAKFSLEFFLSVS